MAGGHFKDGVIDYAGANTPGWMSNLGIAYSAGTLSIVDAQGDPLTPANPGYVTVPSTTPGQFVTLKVTGTHSFNDDAHASSDLTNLGFGITETADWGQNMPFFIYVVNRGNSDIDGADGHSSFFISRNPTMSSTPSAAGNIGDTGAIPATDDQTSILLFTDVTVADYTSRPCQLNGAFRMRWSTTTDDWTIQTLGDSDGLGLGQLSKTFNTTWSFPQGQNGASSGTHMLANGGTAPLFTTDTFPYMIFPNGSCYIFLRMTGDGGTDGDGAVGALIALPYATTIAYDQDYSLFSLHSAGTGNVFWMATVLASAARLSFHAADLTNVINGDFSSGDRWIFGSLLYKVF